MEQHTIVQNEDEVMKSLSWDTSEIEYDSLLKIGHDFENLKQFEVAANAFAEAAELALSLSMDFIKIITGYEAAARCFLQIDNSRAKAYYMHAVDVFLENGYIEKGIQCCVDYGFECQQQLGNKEHAEEFYTLADKLRNNHNLSHSCVIKQFVKSKYGRDIDKVWHEIQKFYIKIKHKQDTTISHISLCMQCIDAYDKLYKYYRDLLKLEYKEQEREWQNLNRGERTEEDLRMIYAVTIETFIIKRININITQFVQRVMILPDDLSQKMIQDVIDDYLEGTVTPKIRKLIDEMKEENIFYDMREKIYLTDEDIFEISIEEIFGINIREIIERIFEEIDKRRKAEERKRMEKQVLGRIECLTESIREKLKISKESQITGKPFRKRKKEKDKKK